MNTSKIPTPMSKTAPGKIDQLGSSEMEDHTLLTFACYHFALVSHSDCMPTNLQELCSIEKSKADLCTKPTTSHVHITTHCSDPSCRNISLEETHRRALSIIDLTLDILDAQAVAYFDAGKVYHELPLSIRAALSDVGRCALAHRQFGGIEILEWNVDPFFQPFLDATDLLTDAGTLIEDRAITKSLADAALIKINKARMLIGRLAGPMQELTQGVDILLAYDQEYAMDRDILMKEERPKVQAMRQAIKQTWKNRIGEIASDSA